MKRSTLSCLVVLVAAALLMAGCTQENVLIGVEGTPAPVLSSFKRAYPEGKIISVRKKVYKDGQVKYNVEFTDAVGRVHDTNYDGNGIMVK